MGLFNWRRAGRGAVQAGVAVDLPCGCRYSPSADGGWESVWWILGCDDHELWNGADLEWLEMKARADARDSWAFVA
jgi:hypothetical protein